MAEWIAVSIAASLPQDMPSTASGAPGSSSCKIARAEKKYSREMARSWSSLGRAKYATDRAATPCHEGHLVRPYRPKPKWPKPMRQGRDIRHAEIRICRTGAGAAARLALGT